MGSTLSFILRHTIALPLYPVSLWKYLTRKKRKCDLIFYLELLEYDCCTSRHRPQSERNCIRQQYREDFIGLPIPMKQIQFPDTSQQKQNNVSLAGCLPHLHVLDNRQHCAQLSDACWTPDREQGELEQRFLMRLQSVCSWSCNACTLNHIAFKLCCSVISNQDGITA